MKRLQDKLGRELTDSELFAFTRKRSGIAYEMIIDYVSDDQNPKMTLRNVVKEKEKLKASPTSLIIHSSKCGRFGYLL